MQMMNPDIAPDEKLEAARLPPSALLYESVRGRLLTNTLALGDRFYESDLASLINVSRTPAREILIRLSAEGLVTRNGRSYSVREFSIDEIGKLYLIREALECLAARCAIENLDDADLSRLGALVAAMDHEASTGNVSAFNLLDCQFHNAIASLSQNVFLVEAMSAMQSKAMLIRNRQLSRPQGLRYAQTDHTRILDALARRLPDVADAEMRHHIRSSVDVFAAAIKQVRIPEGLLR